MEKVSAIWRKLLCFSLLICKMGVFNTLEFKKKVIIKITWESVFKSIQIPRYCSYVVHKVKKNQIKYWMLSRAPYKKGFLLIVTIIKLWSKESGLSLALPISDSKYLTETLSGYFLVFHWSKGGLTSLSPASWKWWTDHTDVPYDINAKLITSFIFS